MVGQVRVTLLYTPCLQGCQSAAPPLLPTQGTGCSLADTPLGSPSGAPCAGSTGSLSLVLREAAPTPVPPLHSSSFPPHDSAS